MQNKDCCCGNKMVEVLNLESWTRVGWFCLNPDCKHFDKAILRERIIKNDIEENK